MKRLLYNTANPKGWPKSLSLVSSVIEAYIPIWDICPRHPAGYSGSAYEVPCKSFAPTTARKPEPHPKSREQDSTSQPIGNDFTNTCYPWNGLQVRGRGRRHFPQQFGHTFGGKARWPLCIGNNGDCRVNHPEFSLINSVVEGV